jgi:hypothetical protein
VRSQIETVREEIQTLEELVNDLPAKDRAPIYARIRGLQAQLMALQGNLVSYGCSP